MSEDVARTLSLNKRRRGVVRASLTRLHTRLGELERKFGDASTHGHAQSMASKLETLDAEFKVHHYSVVNLIDDEEQLQSEQAILDEHDDKVAELSVRVQKLIVTCSSHLTSLSTPRNVYSRKLQRLQKGLSSVNETITALGTVSDNACRLQQHQEQLSDFKRDLAEIRDSLLTMNLDEDDELLQTQESLEEGIFNCSLRIKELLQSSKDHGPSSASDGKGVKLPKLDVPTFNGDILNWRTFWEQFCVSVHDHPTLSDAEKLVYLQHALKDGTAKHTIEGLSCSGEHYAEAIECLRSRFDRPRLIHQTHIRKIIEVPSLKDGSGRELRRFHDTMQQHLRALKAMGHEPSGPFITSLLELKLDVGTAFEWQKHSQALTGVPHYLELLDFVNLRAQASESSISESVKKMAKSEMRIPRKNPQFAKPVVSFTASTDVVANNCVVCKTEKHPLYICTKFRALPHEQKLSTLKENRLCMNCLGADHFVRQCKSNHRCKRCQKPHHTLLHTEAQGNQLPPTPVSNDTTMNSVASLAATGLKTDTLLMTCRVLVNSPNGLTVEARAILDSASSVSFISERLSQSLRLPRSNQNARISGIAGLSHRSPMQSIASFSISAVTSSSKKINVTAVVVPQVTCDLPHHPINFHSKWDHLSGIDLADPGFGQPGKIDILLGVDVFVQVLLHGRRIGPPGSPVAFETEFGCVLAGETNSCVPSKCITSHHVSVDTGDDILRKFWEIEQSPLSESSLTPEERITVQHFKANHHRASDGRFVVPLPKKSDAKPLGESRSQAVRHFLSLERSLNSKGQFKEVHAVVQEYFDLGHAEPVPSPDLLKPESEVFYLPVHVVRKEASLTTKVRAVFDASAKSSSGVSLNETFHVGPTVHPSLVDVLLQFRLHRVALTTDVSKMYRAVALTESDKDLHRFVWRSSPDKSLQDYRMTRVTFGVSASSFAVNMSLWQNTEDFAHKYPLAVKAVLQSFYVDDGLTGADSITGAIALQKELQELFAQGQFLLRKWNSSSPDVLEHISPELRDSQVINALPSADEYSKTLGMEWNSHLDYFRLTVSDLPSQDQVTKRALVSDVAKTFDALGWFSPTTVKMKILLQRVWESKVGWDDVVPTPIRDAWYQWRSELPVLSQKCIPRCYFHQDFHISSLQVHGFCDASEDAYAGVVYLRLTDRYNNVHISLVISKTKVAPIKRLTIPRLELCGAHLLSKLLYHIKEVLSIPLHDVYGWTDSSIVLNWMTGNPRRFKTYVGNRISCIMEQIPPERWNHVKGVENPADCASRGLFPAELVQHNLWWSGPSWLYKAPTEWPNPSVPPLIKSTDEERELCFHTVVRHKSPIIPYDQFSNFSRLRRVTAWVFRFINNCRKRGEKQTSPLTVKELTLAESYWFSLVQHDHYSTEIQELKSKGSVSSTSSLFSLHPILYSDKLLRVGGRGRNSKLAFSRIHPIILHQRHPVTKLLARTEHLRLLHAGPTLMMSSLSQRFHIVGCRRLARFITRECITCQRDTAKPSSQLLGQLPMERITPGPVFERVGVDYAGPVHVKYGYVRKPTIVKAYICVFVSLTVKAVHLELVSDLTTDAFVAALRRFIARRGKPHLIWSDHGTNFVGADQEIKDMLEFLKQQRTEAVISEFCSVQNITWKFIPEHAPHFGGLWEAAVKSMKRHLRRIISNVKLTFEEMTTVLTQVEACMNSRPLAPLPCEGEGLEPLTPGHFLIGKALESLPDPSISYRPISLLRRWNLCQQLIRHFWTRWSTEYLVNLRRFTKWNHPTRNISVGDIVVLQEDGLVPLKWQLARVMKVHPGNDGLVRVATIKTQNGTYKRPVTKLALLLPVKD